MMSAAATAAARSVTAEVPETPPYAPEPDDAFAQPTPYPTIDEPELDDHAPDEDANA